MSRGDILCETLPGRVVAFIAHARSGTLAPDEADTLLTDMEELAHIEDATEGPSISDTLNRLIVLSAMRNYAKHRDINALLAEIVKHANADRSLQ